MATPRETPFRRLGLAVTGFVAAAVGLGGCAGDAANARRSPDSELLATLDGEPVVMADIRAQVGDQLDQLENQYWQRRYEVVTGALERELGDRLLEREAADREMTVEELIGDRAAGLAPVSDAEVASVYEQNRARLGGRSLEEMASTIQEFLSRRKRDGLRSALVQELRASAEVVSYVEPHRLRFDNEGAPSVGPDDAPVTLVEFSDFQCPYCRAFFPTLGRLREAYGDQLRVVYRQFPLASIHPLATKAAEASLCAHEQGGFWAVHDLIFQERRLDVDALREYAERSGLDRARFGACVDSGRFAEQVQRDLRAGSVAGVNGTPAIFVNGILVPGGAVAYEVVAGVIDAELRRVEGE